ncbi:hypothetical protein [Streptomyces solicathayae]|uniref:Uncharacterized protein n=1 Tax=Streptomyces solicathayae TaxID=3081768 RepID=A0ABZ0LVK7_9ACTN|nr:hypothetical protein [Streptomyces sp. HUAS YS2]WOX23360.1 hypothetical protein R2D22_18975 [Streptomyces sp. HUAS YS2]
MIGVDGITVNGHLRPDTRVRVTPFPDNFRPFVSLRIEGDDIEIALLTSSGSADALRDLAAAATEAADTLDALTADAAEATGRG